uniref:Uncharacterized protein n=1 Tax=Anguilla anguilla TaxID=7936 RepID=A0A0E9VFK8_ANGAN
MIHLFPLLF